MCIQNMASSQISPIFFYKINKIIYFTVYTLIEISKFDFNVIFIVLFGAYKIWFIKFKCGLDIILLNISKNIEMLRKYRDNYIVK